MWNIGTYTQDISCNKYNTLSLLKVAVCTVPADRFALNTSIRTPSLGASPKEEVTSVSRACVMAA